MFTQTKLALAIAAVVGMSGISLAHANVAMKTSSKAYSVMPRPDVCDIQQRRDRRDEGYCPDKVSRGETEPGDVKGEGKGHKVARGESEPGDVKGEGKGHKVARGENEPGDVKGEGKGHKVARGENEPGDVKGEGKGHKIFLVREANEPPRGQDNERPGDRQRGRGKLVDDFQLAAREGNEGPRGNDSIAGSGRQRRIV